MITDNNPRVEHFSREQRSIGECVAVRSLEDYDRLSKLMADQNISDSERDDFMQHAERVRQIVWAYADGDVADAVYHATIMHDLSDRFRHLPADDLRRGLAASSILEYVDNEDIDEVEKRFAIQIVADLPSIEMGAEAYRRRIQTLPDVDERIKRIMKGKEKGPIETGSSLWSTELPLIDISHLAEQAKNHNVEAVIIKAAEAIDNLMHRAPTDTSLLQDILEAETFYAPLCELWGLDAMATKLRTEATKHRYEKLGKEEILAQAEAIQSRALETDLKAEIALLLHADAIEDYYNSGANTHDTSEHPLFVSGIVRGGEFDGREIRIRVKSIGSIARKIESDSLGQSPLDIVGITVISEDYQQSARDLYNGIAAMNQSDEFSFATAPSKEQPVYLQGDREYLDVIKKGVVRAKGQYKEKDLTDKTDSPYRVAKFTGIFAESVPFEIQFLTADDRRQARIGMQAHIIFKLMKYNESPEPVDYRELVVLLEQIYDRRYLMDPTAQNVNPLSIVRGDQLIHDAREYLSAA